MNNLVSNYAYTAKIYWKKAKSKILDHLAGSAIYDPVKDQFHISMKMFPKGVTQVWKLKRNDEFYDVFKKTFNTTNNTYFLKNIGTAEVSKSKNITFDVAPFKRKLIIAKKTLTIYK